MDINENNSKALSLLINSKLNNIEKLGNEDIEKLNIRLNEHCLKLKHKFDINSEDIVKIGKSIDKLSLKLKASDIKSEVTLSEVKMDSKSITTKSKTNIENINITKLISNLVTYTLLNKTLFDYTNALINSIDFINDTAKKYVEFSNILLEYNWTPADHVKLNVIENIIDAYKNTGLVDKEKVISRYICDFYDKKMLVGILSDWKKKKLLSSRIGILKDAIEAHTKRKYNLSVPVLLTQIEGIIADGFYHKGQLYEPRINAYLDELFLVSSSGIKQYDKLLIEFFNQNMMVSFVHGDTVTSHTSRHAIIHGKDLKYGTEENSLKLILFLNYLQQKFHYFSLFGDSTYHCSGCNYAHPIYVEAEKGIPASLQDYFKVKTKNKDGSLKYKYFKKHISFFASEEQAINSSNTPCEHCITL